MCSIGGAAFSECPLSSFVICDDNFPFTVVDCLLLGKNGSVCYSCMGTLKECAIPDCVEELCDKCFYRCRSLLRVTFGESSWLERIGSEAFSKSGLTDIFIPSRVKELGAKCFWNCPALSRVTFGKSSSLERIGPDIFLRLPEIVIPQTIEELLSNAGYTCKLQVETTNSSSTA